MYNPPGFARIGGVDCVMVSLSSSGYLLCLVASSLLLRDAIAAHALARIVDLIQDILCGQIAGADDTNANGYRGTIATKPPPRSRQHGEER